MSVILDVGQPYSDASIELCRIFNAALIEVNYPINLNLVPHDDPQLCQTEAWIFGPDGFIGAAGEVRYANNTITISHYELDGLAGNLVLTSKDTITLSDLDSLAKIGNCLKKMYDKNLVR